MDRRTALQLLGITGGSALVLPGSLLNPFDCESRDLPAIDQNAIFARLQAEAPARACVKTEHGSPRMYINDRQEFPFFAVSVGLSKTIKGYRQSGIRFFQPLIGLSDVWTAPGTYEFERLDRYFAQLLNTVPDAIFLPRIHLYAPEWWKRGHESEMVKFGLPIPETSYKLKPFIVEGEFNWWQLLDGDLPSLASTAWKTDIAEVLRAYLRHMEASPLRSRVIGYHVVGGMTSEWHYPASRFLPDYSEPMQRTAGPVPSVDERVHAQRGLLRHPETEHRTIEFYKKFHTQNAKTALSFLTIVKQETKRRVLAGTFYCYLLENVQIQEAGHLVPQVLLESEDVDYLASPYSYQHSNIPVNRIAESDVVDDYGNWLGRARGVGGDGGNRVLWESIRRHNKLFISEIDPTTYLEKTVSTEGGTGHDTVEGTINIIRRDMGNVVSTGIGGWFFDFGHSPSFSAQRGWYDDAPMHEAIRTMIAYGEKRSALDTTPVSEIACVYDAKSFMVTQHWKAEEPYESQGIRTCDAINHWFVNTQARTIHRIGAPADFLYRFDLKQEDAARYKLFLMVNTFFLEEDEADRLMTLFKKSQATVVWLYAPGFVTSTRFDLSQMERLTGFRFAINDTPGSLAIRTIENKIGIPAGMTFGLKKHYAPRFIVKDSPSVRACGYWNDSSDAIAFAETDRDGWRSIYLGAAPAPVEILRPIALRAGARMWSSRPDVVRATEDSMMIVASSDGERTVEFPRPLAPAEGGAESARHTIAMKFGEVKIFQKT
ncbi:MAG TPA: hypothetical protein VK470_01825 [Bacteroidota bacterium]|nr:hypothetical protein [Bacteroidota bacterium]